MLRNKKFFGWKSAGALTAALLFGMMAVGCGSDDNPSNSDKKQGESGASTPAELVGTWTYVDGRGTVSLTISSNSYTVSFDGDPMEKGTLSISGNHVTMTPTHLSGEAINYGNPSTWYTKNQLSGSIPADDLEELFEPTSGTYALNNGRLTFTYDGGDVMIFTKSSGTGPGTDPGTDPGKPQTSLNGTWYADGGYLVLNNGNFEILGPISEDDDVISGLMKGPYQISGNTITLTPNQLSGDLLNLQFEVVSEMMSEMMGFPISALELESKYYTGSELNIAIRDWVIDNFSDKLSEEELEEMISTMPDENDLFEEATVRGTFVLSGNTLTITFEADEDDEPETTVFTRVTGLPKISASVTGLTSKLSKSAASKLKIKLSNLKKPLSFVSKR